MVKKIKPYRAHFRAVVDKHTFEEAQEILGVLNLTIGQVIGMLCTQIVLHRKLPFEIKDKRKDVDNGNLYKDFIFNCDAIIGKNGS